MPSAEYTEAIKEAFASAPSNIVVLDTLELSHPLLGTNIYLVRNRENLTLTLEDSSVHEFIGVAFRMTLPPVGENGLQDLSIVMDNVDRGITDFVRVVSGSQVPAQVKYRPYISTDLTQPQINVPLVLYMRQISLTAFEASAKASFADIVNKNFPSDKYTRSRFPSLGE